MIYLDNAATTRPKPPCVGAAVVEAMNHWGNSGRGAHEEALFAARGIYEVREKIAARRLWERALPIQFLSSAETFSRNSREMHHTAERPTRV